MNTLRTLIEMAKDDDRINILYGLEHVSIWLRLRQL
jgi:hypothetical protein